MTSQEKQSYSRMHVGESELKMSTESLFALSIQLIALADKKAAIIQTERACSLNFLWVSKFILVCLNLLFYKA